MIPKIAVVIGAAGWLFHLWLNLERWIPMGLEEVLVIIFLLITLNFAALVASTVEIARGKHRLWAAAAILVNGAYLLRWVLIAVRA